MKAFAFSTLIFLLFVDAAFSFDMANDCKCRIQASKRIVGGSNADQASYPWTVSVMAKDTIPVPKFLRRLMPDYMKIIKHKCAGVILNERHILTMASCLWDREHNRYDITNRRIGLGDNDLVKIYEEEKYAEIESANIAPDSGVAVLRLKNPLKFSKFIQPACLETEVQPVFKSVLKAVGWGAWELVRHQGTANQYIYDDVLQGANRTLNRQLKEVEMYDQSSILSLCRNRDGKRDDNFICTETVKTNETTCDYDKGSALHWEVRGKVFVVAVMEEERFVHDGPKTFPICTGQAKYVRTSHVLSWIKSVIGDDYCSEREFQFEQLKL